MSHQTIKFCWFTSVFYLSFFLTVPTLWPWEFISHLPTPNRFPCFLLCLLQSILHTAKKLNCLDSPNKYPFPLDTNLNTEVHDETSFTFQGHSPFSQPMLPAQAKSSFSCSYAISSLHMPFVSKAYASPRQPHLICHRHLLFAPAKHLSSGLFWKPSLPHSPCTRFHLHCQLLGIPVQGHQCENTDLAKGTLSPIHQSITKIRFNQNSSERFIWNHGTGVLSGQMTNMALLHQAVDKPWQVTGRGKGT